MRTYIIGSLRNLKVRKLAMLLRKHGIEVFDDWQAAGRMADDEWRAYEKSRGRNFKQALKGAAAQNVFAFDKLHIDRSDSVVLMMPAGKSGHLELGYACNQAGKKTYILFDGEPKRWDVMYAFATDVFFNERDLIAALNK